MTDQESPAFSGEQLFRFATIFYLVLAIAGVVWVGSRTGTIPLELFLKTETLWLDLVIGLLAGLLLAGFWEIGRRALPLARTLEERLGGMLEGLDRMQILSLGVFSGLAEELFFRGAMQSAWGFVPATILFAALHTGRSKDLRLWTAFALVAGALFGGLVLWRGVLLPACLAHFTVNTIGLELMSRRRQEHEELE